MGQASAFLCGIGIVRAGVCLTLCVMMRSCDRQCFKVVIEQAYIQETYDK